MVHEAIYNEKTPGNHGTLELANQQNINAGQRARGSTPATFRLGSQVGVRRIVPKV